MEQYLIDTNVISHYFSASLEEPAMKFMDDVVDAIPNLSVISQIELLCWNTPDLVIEQKIKSFIADSNVIGIDNNIIEICVKLRKAKRIKTPDAIIAATALAANYTLITSNAIDFANIKSLKVINPKSLQNYP